MGSLWRDSSVEFPKFGQETTADPSTHHPQTEKRLWPRSLRMTVATDLAKSMWAWRPALPSLGSFLLLHLTIKMKMGYLLIVKRRMGHGAKAWGYGAGDVG